MQHVQHSFSDHYTICVETGSDRRNRGGGVDLVFWFDADWILEESFETYLKGW